MYWGASRDSQYSGTRKGIGALRVLGTPRGCRGHLACQVCVRAYRGCQGCTGASRDSKYIRSRRV